VEAPNGFTLEPVQSDPTRRAVNKAKFMVGADVLFETKIPPRRAP
jgi:hypothetical protein